MGVGQSKVRSGDTIYSILKRHGFTDNQRKAALSQNILPKDFVLAPGDLYKVFQDKKSGKTELHFYSRNTDKAHTFWRKGSADSAAGAAAVTINYDARPVSFSGKIRGSLLESITALVGDEMIAYRFMDAYIMNYKIPQQVQRNAKFSIVVEKLFEKGQFVRYGEVLRTELEINGRNIVRNFKELSKGGIFYGEELSSRGDFTRPFYAPVEYIRISSLYQPRRFHPIKKFRRAHLGIDFELPEGEPVLAVKDGQVSRFGRNRAAGNFVVLRHAGGFETFYNHLSSIAPLRNGMNISAGMMIGRIGNTGYSTRPHLHFAVKKYGQFINPILMIRSYSYNQREEAQRLVALVSENN